MVGKSTNWPNGLKSHLTAESTIYEHFIHILTTESDKSYRMDILRSNRLSISIRSPSMDQVDKKENNLIHDSPSFTSWINAVALVKKDNATAVFRLVMESPGAVKEQAATSTATHNKSHEAAKVAHLSRLNTLNGWDSGQANAVVSSSNHIR
ncbi:hypothetical protein H4Q26_003074 [Puccinia striiformis f. sp. tritici PST-130]|nr:hypothetical protein H4Q26_003074 [Puccinia striiformis f. sp. tritici PST-130]